MWTRARQSGNEDGSCLYLTNRLMTSFLLPFFWPLEKSHLSTQYSDEPCLTDQLPSAPPVLWTFRGLLLSRFLLRIWTYVLATGADHFNYRVVPLRAPSRNDSTTHQLLAYSFPTLAYHVSNRSTRVFEDSRFGTHPVFVVIAAIESNIFVWLLLVATNLVYASLLHHHLLSERL